VICYASFHKYEGSSYNLACNEAHHLSEERVKILNTIQYDQLIMDSATMPYEVKSRVPAYYEYSISMQEAQEWGILPKSAVFVHYIELNDYDKTHQKKLKSGKFIAVTEKSHYTNLSNTVKYWKSRYFQNGEEWEKNKWMMSAIARKRFLAECKTEKAKEVIKGIENKRFVAFCGSVKQAKELGAKQAVHSANKNNQKLIDDFNLLKISRLFACGMMKEGMNLEQIEAGLIVQLDAGDLGNVQRMGRVLRSSNPELHLICIKDSKDEEYLSSFLQVVN
jgi:superfamily II DNA or RNA helicase